jgi:uncharacterized protein YbcI
MNEVRSRRVSERAGQGRRKMGLSGPSDRASPPDNAAVAATISEEIVQIHTDSYGQVGDARCFMFEDLVITFVDIELLPSEELLVEAGHPELVKEVHDQFEETIRASFMAAVERATGRAVVAFMSQTHIDPHFTIEVFVLDGSSND